MSRRPPSRGPRGRLNPAWILYVSDALADIVEADVEHEHFTGRDHDRVGELRHALEQFAEALMGPEAP